MKTINIIIGYILSMGVVIALTFFWLNVLKLLMSLFGYISDRWILKELNLSNHT